VPEENSNISREIEKIFMPVVVCVCVFINMGTTILEYHWIMSIAKKFLKLSKASDPSQVPQFQNTLQKLYHP
jgi:hypothetical protein